MRAVWIVSLLATLLVGCQTTPRSDGGDISYYMPPPGTRLVLNRSLTIPADQVGVFIQNGRVLTSTEVNRYYPYCKFDLRDRVENTRTVSPDEIFVVRSSQQILSAAHVPDGRAVPVAFWRITSHGDSGPSVMTFSTFMQLRSDKEPQIFRMTCSMWAYPAEGRHVTVPEIRRTLGDLFTLQLPDASQQ